MTNVFVKKDGAKKDVEEALQEAFDWFKLPFLKATAGKACSPHCKPGPWFDGKYPVVIESNPESFLIGQPIEECHVAPADDEVGKIFLAAENPDSNSLHFFYSYKPLMVSQR